MRKLTVVWLGVPVALALALACGGTSSSSTADDAGVNGGPVGSACVFNTRTVFECPSQPLAPGAWVTECVDGSDCHEQVTTSDTVQGCTRKIEIQAAHAVAGTCAAITSSQPAPGSDAAAPVVVDSGGPAPPCSAVSVAGFTPQWHPPRAKSAACTTAQIESFRNCIDDSSTTVNPASCQPWAKPKGDDATCLSCLESNEGDSDWGPLILLPTETLVNVPGCLALAEGKVDGTGCAGALQADQQCDRAACLPACPLGASDPALAAQQVAQEGKCEEAANDVDGGACAAYAVPAQCAGRISIGDAGTSAEQQCYGPPSGASDAIFEAVAIAFCGK